GAARLSMMRQGTPCRASSQAIVSPTGPAPTIRIFGVEFAIIFQPGAASSMKRQSGFNAAHFQSPRDSQEGIESQFRQTRMRILISNDDGIYSPGIAALAEVASRFGEVSRGGPFRRLRAKNRKSSA